MAIQTPTITEIKDNIIASLQASLNQTIPLLPKAFNRVIAAVFAGIFVLLYKYANWIFLQLFVATASNDEVSIYGQTFRPLEAWGDLKGVAPQQGGTRAELEVLVTVINQGGSLPAQTQLVSDDNGVTYLTIGSILLDAATKTVTIRAVSDQGGGDGSGEIGNLDAGAKVNFVNPLGDVQRVTTVQTQVVTGADAETVEEYRTRVIDAYRAQPQGGAYADYRIWGSEVEGIENIYPYTGDPGQVNVYVESSTEIDGIPTDAQVDAVHQSIELDNEDVATRRPVSSLVNVLSITMTAFDVQVTGVSGVEDIVSVQENIRTAVQDYFLNREPFIYGLDVPPRRDRIQQSEVSGTVADIDTGAGGVFTTVTVLETGSPFLIRSLEEGEKAKAGSIVFN